MDGFVTRFIGKGETVIPLLRGFEKLIFSNLERRIYK